VLKKSRGKSFNSRKRELALPDQFFFSLLSLSFSEGTVLLCELDFVPEKSGGSVLSKSQQRESTVYPRQRQSIAESYQRSRFARPLKTRKSEFPRSPRSGANTKSGAYKFNGNNSIAAIKAPMAKRAAIRATAVSHGVCQRAE